MRIYLACTVRGDRRGVVAARAMADRLQRHGHEVLNAHLLSDDVEAAESQLTEEEVYRRDVERLSTCDALVAEASGSSYGVGFEVGYVLGRARHTGQQIVILYDAELPVVANNSPALPIDSDVGTPPTEKVVDKEVPRSIRVMNVDALPAT